MVTNNIRDEQQKKGWREKCPAWEWFVVVVVVLNSSIYQNNQRRKKNCFPLLRRKVVKGNTAVL